MYCCQPQQVLLVSSIHAACFGHTDNPQGFKYMTLKLQNKMHVYRVSQEERT